MPSDPPLPRGNLEFQRKQAKRLARAVRAGEPEAVERAREVMGVRERFLLADAQHVIAAEHGFRSWAAFRRVLERPARARPVGRIGIAPVSEYEARAEKVDAPTRLERRLVVAHEYGYATWRELVEDVERFRAEWATPPEGAMARGVELVRAGDAAGLSALLAEHPELVGARALRGETLLELFTQPEFEVFPDCVDVLVEAGARVNTALNLAACFDKVGLVRQLLDAGASAGDIETWGFTPLQTAIYHGAVAAADVLAEIALVPDTLWVAAATGRVAELPRFFADGEPLPVDRLVRPNLADVGWAPGAPLTDDPDELLGEAFTLACYNGRLEAAAWLLDHGATIDMRPYLDTTALHFAVLGDRPAVVEWLLERGADASIRDGHHGGTPRGWALNVGGREHLAELLP
jgi:hypothetical protein